MSFSVCGYAACVVFSSAPIGSTIFVTATPWIASFFAMTLFTNIYCTGAYFHNLESDGVTSKLLQVLLYTEFGEACGLLDPIPQAIGILYQWSRCLLRVDAFMPLPG